MSKQNNYDLVVVGAGLIGASVALLAAYKMPKCRVALIERSPRLSPQQHNNQRVVALGQLATGVLDTVGVFKDLQQNACFPYQRMFIWDQHSRGELEFSSNDVDLPQLGHMIDSVHCNYLLQRALEAHPQIDVVFDTRIGELENSENTLATVSTNKGCYSAPLIVAADGGQSSIRRLAKISTNQHSYEQIGIVAKIACSLPHQNTAWQRFLKDGPLGVLPLANNQCSIVWSCKQPYAQRLNVMSDKEFCLELAEALEHRLGEVSLVNPRQSFPLNSNNSARYFNQRIVLVGDAAHSIHPLAGQGANLGFKDAQCLVELLSQANEAQDDNLTKLLARYEYVRRSDNQVTDRAMTLLNSAFLQNNPVWSALRGLGMSWVSGSKALKTLLTQQAVGSDPR